MHKSAVTKLRLSMFNFEYTCFRSTIPRTRPRLGSVFLRPTEGMVSLVPRGQIATCQNSLILSLSLLFFTIRVKLGFTNHMNDPR